MSRRKVKAFGKEDLRLCLLGTVLFLSLRFLYTRKGQTRDRSTEKDETFGRFRVLPTSPITKKKKKEEKSRPQKKEDEYYYSYDDDGDEGTDQNACVSFSLFYLLSNFQMTAKRTRRKKKEEIEKKKKQTTTTTTTTTTKRKTRKAGPPLPAAALGPSLTAEADDDFLPNAALFWKEIDEDPGNFFSFGTTNDVRNEDYADTHSTSGSIVAPMSLEETTTDAYYFGTDMRVAKTPERVVCNVNETSSPCGNSQGEMLFVPTPSASGDKAAVTSDCYHQEQGQNVLQDEEDEDNDGGSSRNYLEDLAAMHGIVLRSTDGDDDNLTEEDVKTAAVVTAATGSTDTYEEQAYNISHITTDDEKRKKANKTSSQTSTPSPSPSITTRSISKAKKNAERLKHLASRKRWEATLKTATAIARTNVAEEKLQNLEKVASQKNFFLKSESKNGASATTGIAIRNTKGSSDDDITTSGNIASKSLKKYAVEHVSSMSSQEEVLAPAVKNKKGQHKWKRRARQEQQRRVIVKPNAILFTKMTKDTEPAAASDESVNETVLEEEEEEEEERGRITRTRKRQREQHRKEREQSKKKVKSGTTTNCSFSALLEQNDDSTKKPPRKKKYQKKKKTEEEIKEEKEEEKEEAMTTKVNISAVVDIGARATDMIVCSTTGKERVIGCFECGITHTPQWRQGQHGPKTLCNRCGVAYRKRQLLNHSILF